MTTGLIVGATGGIGAACLAALAGSAETIIATGRNAGNLAETVAAHQGAVPVIADIATDAGRGAILSAVRATGTKLRWAVIASGAPLRGPLAELDPAEIAATFQSNLVGPALLLREMSGLDWASDAALVVIGSVSANRALANRSVYAASKAGLERLTLSIAAEWAPRGIRVTIVAPGVIATPFLGNDRARLDKWTSERVPAGRAGEASEVGELVRYVILEAPAYLLGTRIVIDGGTEAIA